MNTDKYYWKYIDSCVDEDDHETMRMGIDLAKSWYKFISTPDGARWTTARGSGKSNTEDLIRYLAKVYSEDNPNKNATVFCKNTVVAKLPDSYPKGDIADLLGIGEAEYS